MNRKWIKGWENLEIKKRGIQLAQETGFDVQRLADYYEMSTRTLNRRFQQQLGKTPEAWLERIRFNIAGEMVLAGKTVKEISITLGYSNSSNFSQAFKRHFGCTPLNYYIRHQEKGKRIGTNGLSGNGHAIRT